MPSGAAQLPVTAAVGVVTAQPSSVAERRRRCNLSEVCAGQPAAAAVVAVQDVRTPATPSVALYAMRTDVRPTGRADVRCPHARCDAGVRTGRRPVSATAAAALSAPRWITERVGAAGLATLSAPSSTCRRGVGERLVVAAESGLAGKGWSCVGQRVAGTSATADLGRRFARAQAGRRACRLGDQGSRSSVRCRSDGWGAWEGAGAHTSPRRCVLGRLPA
jgi:hypothetical protein